MARSTWRLRMAVGAASIIALCKQARAFTALSVCSLSAARQPGRPGPPQPQRASAQGPGRAHQQGVDPVRRGARLMPHLPQRRGRPGGGGRHTQGRRPAARTGTAGRHVLQNGQRTWAPAALQCVPRSLDAGHLGGHRARPLVLHAHAQRRVLGVQRARQAVQECLGGAVRCAGGHNTG